MGAVSVAMTGETECGEAWNATFTPARTVYIVADGLGHGPSAAEAAREAVQVFEEAAQTYGRREIERHDKVGHIGSHVKWRRGMELSHHIRLCRPSPFRFGFRAMIQRICS